MESNYENYASVQTVFSIKLKFDVYIVDRRFCYYINFGVSKRYTFYKTQKISYISAYRLKISKGVLVLLNYLNLYKISEWYIPFIMYGPHWK